MVTDPDDLNHPDLQLKFAYPKNKEGFMEETEKKPSKFLFAVITLVVLNIVCAVLFIVGFGLFALNAANNSSIGEISTQTNDQPLDEFQPDTAPPSLSRPAEKVSGNTLSILQNTIVPINDPLDIACRLDGKCAIPATLPSGPYSVGDVQTFWLTNTDTVTPFQIDATLEYATEHAYLWVENDVTFDLVEAKDLVDTFEREIYPTNLEFFGSEANPGIDEDEHIYIVYGRGIGASVAGYFSSPDEFHPDAHEYSNAHEMFVFNADNSPLDDPYTFGVLAHEHQHMVHFFTDRNEETWMNEGFSELSVLLNGLYSGGADRMYIANTDMQLNDWGPNPGTNGPHYGASFLFLSYFLDRFGEASTQTLVTHPQNGFTGIDETLVEIGALDPFNGEQITADDVFMDWAVTNLLLDDKVADGRYDYQLYDNPKRVNNANLVTDCPTELNGSVFQYGVDYVHIRCSGVRTLTFEGSTVANLLPISAFSGENSFWSNKGDESDMTLTQEFDFTSVNSDLSLDFQTWYDLETDYDYVFVEYSLDEGATWTILDTPSGTDEDPSGNSYGVGYNGQTGGWIEESVDISVLAGRKALLRFEYITDAAVNGEGLLLDDISIPAIGYFSDLESDDGGWKPSGFVQVDHYLPQTFRVMLIDQNGETTVKPVVLSEDQTATLMIDMSDVTLVISGTTRFTREQAAYRLIVR